MEAKITKQILSSFTYEIIERIVRFIMHLEEIEAQFYYDNKDKKLLISNYKDSLYILLSVVLVEYKRNTNNTSDEKFKMFFKLLKGILQKVNILHKEKLSILPRPSEPIELTRFERVIHKQIVQLTDSIIKKDISITLNEEIGEQYSRDYLLSYKEGLEELFSQHNISKYAFLQDFVNKNKNDDKESINITIPRIDASNTFRWPSLIHEMCHSLFSHVVFEHDSIENEFLDIVNGSRDDIFDGHFLTITKDGKKSKLSYWLEECWCDLFACILIGPSFYFSQYIAFLNTDENNDSPTHPPHTFRLELIESIIRHRFPELHEELLGVKYISRCENLTAFLQEDKGMSFREKSIYSRIFNSFNLFFTSHFLSFNKEDGSPVLRNNPEISVKLNVIVNKYVRVHPEVIKYLIGRLKYGLPIPSIKTINAKNKYEEIPTYVQEIFLASWLSRFDDLIPTVLKTIKKVNSEKIKSNIEKYYNDIKKLILRHDQAVLKSIQVSEWFDFLIKEERRPEKINIYKKHSITKKFIDSLQGVLVDKEIKTLIYQDELKIIPMMYLEKKIGKRKENQIGTTSLDIRLGTSFQVFYPDQYGIIDFTEENSKHSFSTSSKRINLDFIEGITITPGQFLLGHSMEYIKLPDYICGNLEGRSSFARLGIEIHMTAGYIDPGFEGVLTFEIYNAGPTTVKLYPGIRLGQIRFEKTNIPQITYSKKHRVKYKGLLEHDISRQSKDFEVELIKKYNNSKN